MDWTTVVAGWTALVAHRTGHPGTARTDLDGRQRPPAVLGALDTALGNLTSPDWVTAIRRQTFPVVTHCHRPVAGTAIVQRWTPPVTTGCPRSARRTPRARPAPGAIWPHRWTGRRTLSAPLREPAGPPPPTDPPQTTGWAREAGPDRTTGWAREAGPDRTTE
ncbi:hypothetical protein Pen02_45920 [Plantactinospora endophytica]|uniref:Uncharacterized protein n=1 Tax=Plantactinospora endophytica TaxID=673535 RepID=A0ABQ4E5Q2_9ACTN|nr:hypothetical protein Pen02_45920 [Plantactinospora endophytica]